MTMLEQVDPQAWMVTLPLTVALAMAGRSLATGALGRAWRSMREVEALGLAWLTGTAPADGDAAPTPWQWALYHMAVSALGFASLCSLAAWLTAGA